MTGPALPAVRRPPGRYDEPRAPAWLLPLVGGVLAAALVAGLVVSYGRTQDRRTDATLLSYDVVSDSAVVVRFRVRKEEAEEVTCALRALDYSGGVVGAVDVVVPAGTGTTEHEVATRDRAVLGEVVGCSAPRRPTP